MRAVFLDDEKSSHINFKYAVKDRRELTEIEYFFEPLKALEFIKNVTIDCAFLDIIMPGMNGIMLADEIRRIQSDCKIVFVTADAQNCRNYKELGAVACLVKPYAESELIEILGQLNSNA